MKKSQIASDFRLRGTAVLVEEFAGFPFLIFLKDLVRISNLLDLTPATIKRYLKEAEKKDLSTFDNQFETTWAGKRKFLENKPDKKRAIVVLKRNGFNWREISKLLKMSSSEAARKQYKRLMKKLSIEYKISWLVENQTLKEEEKIRIFH